MSKSCISLKEHQDIMLRLLIEFDNYCSQNNLRYYLTRGTLLGAVRHHGFIPWDDDADVVMPRPDYEKLIKESYISPNVQVLSIDNPQGHYHPFPYCNIVDTCTVLEERNIKHSTNKGVFIDVFPLDGLPDQNRKKKLHLSRLMILQTLLSNAINIPSSKSAIKNMVKKMLSMILQPIDEHHIARKIVSVSKKYKFDSSNYCAHTVQLKNEPERFITSKLDYESFLLMDFENAKFRVPVGYDSILRRCYGEYMELPSDPKGHHGIEVFRINIDD